MDWSKETAATLTKYYPGFTPASPPSGAQRAWQGILRPLLDNHELNPILADLDIDARLNILEDGTLHHDPTCQRNHQEPWYANHLRGVRREFTILLADIGPDRHPQVFCTKPTISGILFPTHPHLRRDLQLWHNGTPLHALCTYLSSDGSNPADDMSLVRALDYTSIFLAKHTVWTNTATLTAYEHGKLPRTITTDPTGIGLHFRPTKTGSIEYRWEGYWPGNAAPHTPAELLATTNPEDDCPCGKRKTYAACCRNEHREAVRRTRLIPPGTQRAA